MDMVPELLLELPLELVLLLLLLHLFYHVHVRERETDEEQQKGADVHGVEAVHERRDVLREVRLGGRCEQGRHANPEKGGQRDNGDAAVEAHPHGEEVWAGCFGGEDCRSG